MKTANNNIEDVVAKRMFCVFCIVCACILIIELVVIFLSKVKVL